VAGGIHGDPGGAIEEGIAIHVLDHRSGAARHHEGIAARI
jgi:hypothetical protein